ncbi:MAG: sigma 54-interacting transcriptional regulator [Clostridiales bacterium]|nr:sigma 54-interacting transcriptional regulator [Clostridiales bacterium]
MNEKFIEISHPIIKNMFQIIYNIDTTIVMVDENCKVVQTWTNVSSKQEYILDIEEGDDLSESIAGANAIGQALLKKEYVELNQNVNILNKSSKMYNIALPIFNAYNEVVGALGVFGPGEYANLDFIRGTLKMTIIALEGQLKSMAYKADYDKVYNQLLGTMETIPLGTMVTDNSMTIIHVNDATLKIFGDEIDDIVGKDLDEYLHTGDFFQNMLNEGKTMLDEEMTFYMPQGSITCEVIVSLVKGEQNKNIQGLVIKFKNVQYMHTFKKSKDVNRAHFNFEDVIGQSSQIKEAIRLGKIAARSTSNVLLLGESGTGKELFAQAIHNHSARREGPFVAVNCGALPSGLIESELFGYEGGAFTGAKKEGQAGKFEQANGGTLFLDEIADMPLQEQITLLRVLQNKEVVRVGGNRIIKINVRVIAATNVDIEKKVLENKFRKDLFYRLNVFSITIPPLRERAIDILLLAEIFLKRYSVILNKDVIGISSEVKEALVEHQWPGNIRELENVIERAVNITRSNILSIEDLPSNFYSQSSTATINKINRELTLIEQNEKSTIIEGLIKCNGNISKTADLIGIGRRSLYRRLEYYGINSQKYKTKSK